MLSESSSSKTRFMLQCNSFLERIALHFVLEKMAVASDKYTAIGEMLDFCMVNGIESYAKLLLYAKSNRIDWFHVLCANGTVTIVQFLKSRYWELRRYNARDKQ